MKILRKVLGSKYWKRGLDLLGAILLGAAVSGWLFTKFILEIHPGCYTGFALISTVKCEGGLDASLMMLILNTFSIYSIGIVTLAGYGLIMTIVNLHLSGFVSSLLIILIYSLMYLIPARFVFKSVIDLTFERQLISHRLRFWYVGLLILALAIPTTLWLYKMEKLPPQNSHKIIQIDMWHARFEIPRYYLTDWPLVSIPRPETKPSAFSHLNNNRRLKPRFKLSVRAKDIDPSWGEEMIEINFNARYEHTENPLELAKEDFDRIVNGEDYKDRRYYANKAQLDKGFYVYRAMGPQSNKRDIYTKTENKNAVTRWANCQTNVMCKTQKNFKNFNEINADTDAAGTCELKCSAAVSNNPNFTLAYWFPKNKIEQYYDADAKIWAFIMSFKKQEANSEISRSDKN